MSPVSPRARLPHLVLSWAAVLIVPAISGCEKVAAPATASEIQVVQGNLQSAAAGTVLPTPVVVRVRSSDGSPVTSVPVGFSVQRGGGTVEPATGMSDANGEVKTKWTLGPHQNIHELLASVPGVDGITITAIGILPTDLIVAQGNNQSAKAGTALPTQIVLRIIGSNSTPIPGIPVSLSVTAGGGAINPSTAITNANGEVTVRWTLGTQQGLQNIQAAALNLAPIVLSATGT